MNLNRNDSVVTAYAERAAGPGWSNVPIWVIVRSEDGTLRQECIQPEDQTAEMITLYSASEAVHLSMRQAVKLRSAKTQK